MDIINIMDIIDIIYIIISIWNVYLGSKKRASYPHEIVESQ